MQGIFPYLKRQTKLELFIIILIAAELALGIIGLAQHEQHAQYEKKQKNAI
jgi:hypothetical protein